MWLQYHIDKLNDTDKYKIIVGNSNSLYNKVLIIPIFIGGIQVKSITDVTDYDISLLLSLFINPLFIPYYKDFMKNSKVMFNKTVDIIL